MDREDYSNDSYSQPHVPPATAPVIDEAAAPADAAERARQDGDSDCPGTKEASVHRSGEDEEIALGDTPDEIVPGDSDRVMPKQSTRPEIEPGTLLDETQLAPD